MALISCPRCGRENVSDRANFCPNCGFAIRDYVSNMNGRNSELLNVSYTDMRNDALAFEQELNIKKSYKIKRVIISLIILLVIVISCVGGYCYYKTKLMLDSTHKLWKDFAYLYNIEDYSYSSEIGYNCVNCNIKLNLFYPDYDSYYTLVMFLDEVDKNFSNENFQINYKIFIDDVHYWTDEEYLYSSSGDKIELAEVACKQLKTYIKLEDYRYVEAMLVDFPKEYFEKHGDLATQEYESIVINNKVKIMNTDNGVSSYLYITKDNLKSWALIEQLGYKLQEFGGEDISEYVSYAKEVQKLEEYIQYNDIIKYTNSYSYSYFFQKIATTDINSQYAVQNTCREFEKFNYSNLNSYPDPISKKLYDCLHKYNEGMINYYNGTWGGAGSSVAKNGQIMLLQALDEMESIIYELTEIEFKIINAVAELPDI